MEEDPCTFVMSLGTWLSTWREGGQHTEAFRSQNSQQEWGKLKTSAMV
jgi:hypothetical protein